MKHGLTFCETSLRCLINIYHSCQLSSAGCHCIHNRPCWKVCQAAARDNSHCKSHPDKSWAVQWRRIYVPISIRAPAGAQIYIQMSPVTIIILLTSLWLQKSKQKIKKYLFKRSLTANNPDDDAVADDGDDHYQGEGEGPHHLQGGHWSCCCCCCGCLLLLLLKLVLTPPRLAWDNLVWRGAADAAINQLLTSLIIRDRSWSASEM